MDGVAQRVTAVDIAIVTALNGFARESAASRTLVSVLAERLALVEVLLMGLLALGGRGQTAARMLAAVSLVYVASEGLGAAWPRERPFERLSTVVPLVAHMRGRSFPSRHVASGLAMAAIGQRAHRRLGGGMAWVAWLLGLSRVAAGLHYPSDIVAGGLLGVVIGVLLHK
jgi:membrane-associated phospholipid phosphatase